MTFLNITVSSAKGGPCSSSQASGFPFPLPLAATGPTRTKPDAIAVLMGDQYANDEVDIPRQHASCMVGLAHTHTVG